MRVLLGGWLIAGTTAYALLWLVGSLFLAAAFIFRDEVGWIGVVILLKPMVFFTISGGAFLFWSRAANESRQWLRPTALALLAAALFLRIYTPWGFSLPFHEIGFSIQAALVPPLLWRLVAKGRAIRFGSRVFVTALSGVLLVACVSLLFAESFAVTNSFGLLSGPPNSTVVKDYALATNKDNYPSCTFEYNSLGYRDIEPTERRADVRRVLVIGETPTCGGTVSQPMSRHSLLSFDRHSTAALPVFST